MKKVLILFLLIYMAVSVTACAAVRENKGTTGESTASSVTQSSTEQTNTDTTALSDTVTAKEAATTKKATTTKNALPPIEEGTVSGNTYTNKSLGIVIAPPKTWEYSEEEADAQSDYFAAELNESQYGYDFKSITVGVSDSGKFKTTEAYIRNLEKHGNNDPDYMKTVRKPDRQIGNRTYMHLSYEYPSADYVYYELFACCDGGKLVVIAFNQLDEKGVNNFINNYIHETH